MGNQINYQRIFAIQAANKQRILKANPDVPETSGIYILTSFEDGVKYAYVGQAKNILERLAQHLSGYQWIDMSLKKHGLYSISNPTGWHIYFDECSLNRLDDSEQYFIKDYLDLGFQMRNNTLGGQGEGKIGIGDNIRKGYQAGLHKGYQNALKDIAKMFEKNLTVQVNGQTNKNKEKALQKFKDMLKGLDN